MEITLLLFIVRERVLPCLIFTLWYQMDHKRAVDDESDVSDAKRTAATTSSDNVAPTTTIPPGDLACFQTAYLSRDSFLCPQNGLASMNCDVADLVRRALVSPKLVTQIKAHELFQDDLVCLDLGAAECARGWQRITRTPVASSFYAASRLGESTIIWSGGENENEFCEPSDRCVRFCLRSRVLECTVALPFGLSRHQMVTLDGCPCVLGGMDADDFIHSAVLLNKFGHSWKAVSAMPMPCSLFEAATISSYEIAIIVGVRGQRNLCHVYDGRSSVWRKWPDLPGNACGSVAIGSAFFVYDHTIAAHGFHSFDERGNQWTRHACSSKRMHEAAFATIDDTTIAMFGGHKIDGACFAPSVSTCDIYDIRANQWRTEPDWNLPCPMSEFKVCCVSA